MLAPGTRVGAYTVLGVLGAGGMGEVYRASDPRLEREVALKLLPRELAQDAEQMARFRREALTLASLNHPNIATIYGFEEPGDGLLALVLERVEGESLADRLTRGALPVDEALQVCAQIAEALEVAHERGVVHRDLKPGNVMLGQRGLVKVLDFGLAKRHLGLMGLREPEGGGAASPPQPSPAAPVDDAAAADAPTRDAAVTQYGAVLGTPGYMSPEQVLAGAQDERTDIFAFGCVLFECLTGQRAFSGRDEFTVMAAVLSEPIDLSRLPERTPGRVRKLLERCMEKDAERRLAEMRVVRTELEEALGIRRAAALRTGEAVSTAPHNLPRALSSFVGRERETEICRRLMEEARLLTLTGAGGSGKTRLALRLAEGALGDHPDGVWFVDLAPLTESERVVHATAATLGLRVEPGRGVLETLIEHLAPRRCLLVFDNCEHVLSAAAELAVQLLQEASQLRLLATSREGLGVPGERVHPVPPLELPPRAATLDPEALAAFESVRLFVERARQVRPAFALNGDTAAVVDICRRLDGLPLAIELAAARVRVLAVEQIRAKLDDRFRLLTGGGRGALPRHQTLRATIQWSFDQLSEPEQQLLRGLSVFVGGWTLGGATQVCEDLGDEFEILDLLTHLVDKSLVVVERDDIDEPRYRFLESVRQFALEQLAPSGENPVRRTRHMELFLALAEEAETRLLGPEQGAWLKRLDPEHENLLGALNWCGQAEDGASKGLRMAAALSRFWSAHGHYDVGRRQLEEALARPGASASSTERATALVRTGGMALYQGDYAAARPYIEQSLAIYRTLGDARGVARTLSGLGTVASYLGDYSASRAYHEESLHLYRELGAKRGEAVAMHNLGDVAWCTNDLAAARSWFEQALARMREVGDEENIALTLSNLASVQIRVNELEASRASLVEALMIVRGLGARREGAHTLERAAELAAVAGEPALAARFLGVAETLRKATGLLRPREGVREYEALVERLRSALGAEGFSSELVAANGLSLEGAVEEALAWLAVTSLLANAKPPTA